MTSATMAVRFGEAKRIAMMLPHDRRVSSAPEAKRRSGVLGVRNAREKFILCVLPRRLRRNPLTTLLNGYEVAAAATAGAIARLVRARAYDGYVVHSPLDWLDTVDACRRIRGFDPNAPLIVFANERSALEKQDVLAAGAQAYVARSDDVHNLPGTAGQLIMLAELRSLDALSAAGGAMRQKLVARLAKACEGANGERAINVRWQLRLKRDAGRVFAEAGGTRANFERLWPTLYANALSDLGSSDT
jgi:CheY-like chemotaxis protein